MSTGLLNSLMNAQSQTATPAGQQMQVVMIPNKNIFPNPDNEIYSIGNVEGLKDDIRQNGLRQPLEVIPVEGKTERYMLISGHRRWIACTMLGAAGESRFDTLPCLIRESHGELDDRIALITANATARDLTDGERLAQYEALKDALTRKKSAGQLEGKVRDEVCRILGLSTGAAARLNVIASCENELIKERLKAGEIGLMEAYRSAQDYARFMGAAPEESEQKEEPAETPLKSAPEFPKWVIASAKEVCEMDLFKKSSEFTAKALSAIVSESGMCGRSLKTGFVNFYRDKILFWKDGNENFTFTWAKFIKLCVEQKIVHASEPAETIPVNPDYAERKLPPEAVAMVEKAHEEQKKAQNDAPKPAVNKSVSLPSVYSGQKCDYSTSHRCENEAGLKHFIKHGGIQGCAGSCRYCKSKDTCEYSCAYASKDKETQEQPKEQARGRDTLHKLAEKTLAASAAWELEWEDVRFRLAYYKQPLPGGAKLWKRIDTTREDAGQTCDDYAIILQDNSFFTCGWIGFHSGITDILTDYFELK